MDHTKAVDVLRLCATPVGMQASGARRGHHQVWARDCVVTLLGARFVADEQIQAALHAGLSLLREKRAPSGAIPNNVDCETLRPNFRAYADAGLWWIVGSALLAPDPATTAGVLAWCEGQDVDRTGLLSMQESSDWQDLFCTRGKGLYLNCLYVMALRAAGQEARAQAVAAAINRHFWYRGDGDLLRHMELTFSTEFPGMYDSLGRKRWFPVKQRLVEEQYYLPYLGFRAAGEWFDSLGNVMAILAGVADPSQTATILDFIERHGMADAPLRSLTPAVLPGQADWRDYYGVTNQPHHHHNGGVWPFIGGFYVAALVKAGRLRDAAGALERLEILCCQGNFNEWHHGQTLQPLGVESQAWSAGMYLFACECVSRSDVPDGFFGIGGQPG